MNWNSINKKLLAKCILIPLGVGALAALFTRQGMVAYQTVEQPPLSPSMWVFPVVWTILYVLMGIASYLVYTSGAEEENISRAISVYGAQLAVNFLWPTFFFNFQWYLFSFFWLLLLWVLVFITIRQFYDIRKWAGYLMIPYLIWLTFAAYLNLGVWWLNR